MRFAIAAVALFGAASISNAGFGGCEPSCAVPCEPTCACPCEPSCACPTTAKKDNVFQQLWKAEQRKNKWLMDTFIR